MNLAICIALKNRSCLSVPHEDEKATYAHVADRIQLTPSDYLCPSPPIDDNKVYLTPLPNLLSSLVKVKRPTDFWTVIIIDYESTDVDVKQLCEQILGDMIPFYIYTVCGGGPFDRGGGLDLAAQVAQRDGFDSLFFCDADMYITNHYIFDEAARSLAAGKIYYPTCFSYTSHTHERGFWRDSGYGMLFIRTDDYFISDRWKHNKSWGWEDRALHDSFPKEKINRGMGVGLFHQWHPNSLEFKTQEYAVKQMLGRDAVY